MEVDESEHSGRGFRQRKGRTSPMCCPICGVTLRVHEIDHHFAVEVDRLERILKPKKQLPYGGGLEDGTNTAGPSYSNGEGPSHSGSGNSSTAASRSNGHNSEENVTSSIGPDECWGTYQKIKNNRQARLKLKSRKRKPEDNVCPICNKVTLDDITLHVEACLRKSESQRNGANPANNGSEEDDDDDDDASIDVEGESFDVYEWAGQKRVRATGLLGAGTLGGLGVRITNADDTDDELNVDGDESQVYGPPQYSERDVIVTGRSAPGSSALRELLIANDPQTVKPPTLVGSGGGGGTGTGGSGGGVTGGGEVEAGSSGTESRLVESLKAKVREYEGYIRNRPKCLICMDDFRKPIVSVCCWHVYCEECWLHTLGAKKLCPQCSMITSPTDLRRIYL
ncbi:E3 ubiquitin-protein ligase RNF220 [Anopheles maculipalpis]|uniref:E3 ubiquitin-protein ligase RNF220 n=1 Tax=Anopheles maculipalpis TaxID=1496333 RepID=UPI002158EB03|nr:E3 ubiquitin-protein ligase RNF220 [Anopheles maculipalpis]